MPFAGQGPGAVLGPGPHERWLFMFAAGSSACVHLVGHRERPGSAVLFMGVSLDSAVVLPGFILFLLNGRCPG